MCLDLVARNRNQTIPVPARGCVWSEGFKDLMISVLSTALWIPQESRPDLCGQSQMGEHRLVQTLEL